jgi:hypothetical protein
LPRDFSRSANALGLCSAIVVTLLPGIFRLEMVLADAFKRSALWWKGADF